MSLKVSKFGGSSLVNAEQVGRVCDIVAADPGRRIVVVSAPGKGEEATPKVTDLLIACAESRLCGGDAKKELAAVVARYESIVADLGLESGVLTRISEDLAERVGSDISNQERYVDTVKAGGEDCSAWLVAEALRSKGVNAAYLSPSEAGMVLSSEYGAAVVLDETYDNLRKLRDADGVTVFPGFFGVTREGDTVTFPRGGSDISGAVLAAAVGADVYENFTDVDCVFAVDPRVVQEAEPIPILTYREMRELSYAGFGVFHDEAIVPAVKAGVPICIKNTNRPEAPGTLIVPEREHEPGAAVGIASSDGFCSLYVSKYMMNREIGFGRRLLGILEQKGLSYEHTPSGIDNMSVILREDHFDAGTEKAVATRIAVELNVEVSVERGLALLMIVGEGMQHAAGAAARATSALANVGVNIEMMNQGSSEISMMFGVKAEDRELAISSLYDVFFKR